MPLHATIVAIHFAATFAVGSAVMIVVKDISSVIIAGKYRVMRESVRLSSSLFYAKSATRSPVGIAGTALIIVTNAIADFVWLVGPVGSVMVVKERTVLSAEILSNASAATRSFAYRAIKDATLISAANAPTTSRVLRSVLTAL